MAAPMAAAASRLLKLQNPALQSLIRSHLLRPAAASLALPEHLSLDPFHPEKDSPNRYTSNLQSPNLPVDLRCRVGFSPIGIEAARTYVSINDDADYLDSDGEDEDDDNVDDEDEDDLEIQGYSGSDLEEEE